VAGTGMFVSSVFFFMIVGRVTLNFNGNGHFGLPRPLSSKLNKNPDGFRLESPMGHV
jgi:hypothetical protein